LEQSTVGDSKKIFVLDTSVLVHDPDALENFQDNTIVLHIVVLEELDHLKKSPDEVGQMARLVIRKLDQYRQNGSLSSGVSTSHGGELRVEFSNNTEFENLLSAGLNKTNDNHLISLAKKLQFQNPSKEIILVSKDLNLRVKADACGVKSQDYEFDKKGLYSGIVEIDMQNEEHDLVHEIHTNSKNILSAERVFECAGEITDFPPNQCCVLKNYKGKSALAVFKKAASEFRLVKSDFVEEALSLKSKKREVYPKNTEQCFAYHLLMDPKVILMTMVGKAGSGKTLIALYTGYNQVGEENSPHDQLLIYRPNIELGKSLGYLPGSIKEKFEPWMQPVLDNLDLVLKDREKNYKSGFSKNQRDAATPDNFRDYIDQGFMEISPITFIRGRSLHHKFIIIDEAQNLTKHEIKTILTRPGEGTKVVLTGDLDQIDNRFVNSESNGLAHVVQKFKGQEIFGHITMKKTERSLLAQLAADLL